ncbi:MAG: hypothetical protein JSV04_13500 [Candidatus Heimdallarchaeota archaeon]|nr:MAG: hypothetical protein JSV04_13500 [Candidatus Heimdallarchaeota archaeon]
MPTNFRIAVQTDDLRLYHKLLRIFEGSHLKPRFFTPNQTIPSQYFDLIITTEELIDNLQEPPILQLKSAQVQPNLKARIISIIARKSDPKFKLLIVGIDPGEHIGLAAICDGMVLAAETIKLTKLTKKIEEYLILFPSEIVVIRIGDQPTSVSRVLFNKLFTVFGNIDKIKLEIVEEAYSSIRKVTPAVPFSSDETAAITIAYRTGKIKNHLVRSNIPIGRIKEIQKWSRNLSNNRITLDTELAQSVALGEISLEEAIIRKEKQLEAKKNE